MRYSIIFLFLVTGCATNNLSLKLPGKTTPAYRLDPVPERILLLHTYNVDSKKYRKNKTALFKKFIDSILVTCRSEIKKRESISTEVLGYTNMSTTNNDSIYILMKVHQATHAIVISSFDVGFIKTNVKVETSGNGSKSRTASYDITSDINFLFYTSHSLYKESQMTKTVYYASRSVASGILSAGPNIVVQKRDAWKLIRSNLDDYLNLFFRNNFS